MNITAAPSRTLEEFGSAGVVVSLLSEDDALRVSLATFASGSTIGPHPTGYRQRFCVVDGAGWVSGADGARREVTRGDLVDWDVGEDHASGSDGGMVAVIIQWLR